MRVIAGAAKGTRLAPVPAGTRPLSDRAREGLFSSLGADVEGARCADLYAGTGAVGVEALSRGAEWCLFVDSSSSAIRAIRDNLARTGLEDRAGVVRSDVARALERQRQAFDLAFLDPPYDTAEEALAAALSLVTPLIASGGALVLTRPKRDGTDVVPIHWARSRLLTYGDARILICREAT